MAELIGRCDRERALHREERGIVMNWTSGTIRKFWPSPRIGGPPTIVRGNWLANWLRQTLR